MERRLREKLLQKEAKEHYFHSTYQKPHGDLTSGMPILTVFLVNLLSMLSFGVILGVALHCSTRSKLGYKGDLSIYETIDTKIPIIQYLGLLLAPRIYLAEIIDSQTHKECHQYQEILNDNSQKCVLITIDIIRRNDGNRHEWAFTYLSATRSKNAILNP
ncbi:predicted protein [Sclerotinia sclerotiorum 1980 UF-70]|uniref:Uncharacterized protein n=1 Tax=Sclerotinia sclerotiorum (strain ATCC 18683 / 1980 / Ss-1) TaxID=665079 RepID=A7F961_SCLS1|nr:predicted protein [Sclerotinia sclerotiorum 1980 UF-70]EDO00272.1 predicted protein [Sclerotinia sclerotiorum 1980 UF-70]